MQKKNKLGKKHKLIGEDLDKIKKGVKGVYEKYNFKRIGAAAAAAVMLTVSGCSLYPDGKSYSWERQNNGTQEAT